MKLMELIQCSQSLVPHSAETTLSATIASSPAASSTSTTVPVPRQVKLPELELPIFKGDPIEWRPFWSMFKITIHENQSLDPIYKFHYLTSHLRGEAARAIAGLAQTAENYPVAIDLLQKSYGQ